MAQKTPPSWLNTKARKLHERTANELLGILRNAQAMYRQSTAINGGWPRKILSGRRSRERSGAETSTS